MTGRLITLGPRLKFRLTYRDGATFDVLARECTVSKDRSGSPIVKVTFVGIKRFMSIDIDGLIAVQRVRRWF